MKRLAALLVVATVGFPACERVAVAHGCDRARPTKATCVDRWRSTAIQAGWSPSSWPWLRCVIWRESAGNPRAHNTGDPSGGSRGLMQINGVHVAWMRHAGIISTADNLYNPATNLRAARALHRLQGRRAWASTTKGC